MVIKMENAVHGGSSMKTQKVERALSTRKFPRDFCIDASTSEAILSNLSCLIGQTKLI